MKPWHSMKIEEAIHALNVKSGGLSNEDAKKRLQEHGPNELKKEKESRAYYFSSDSSKIY